MENETANMPKEIKNNRLVIILSVAIILLAILITLLYLKNEHKWFFSEEKSNNAVQSSEKRLLTISERTIFSGNENEDIPDAYHFESLVLEPDGTVSCAIGGQDYLRYYGTYSIKDDELLVKFIMIAEPDSTTSAVQKELKYKIKDSNTVIDESNKLNLNKLSTTSEEGKRLLRDLFDYNGSDKIILYINGQTIFKGSINDNDPDIRYFEFIILEEDGTVAMAKGGEDYARFIGTYSIGEGKITLHLNKEIFPDGNSQNVSEELVYKVISDKAELKLVSPKPYFIELDKTYPDYDNQTKILINDIYSFREN